MIRKPNAIQKLLHRFFMLRPVTAFFAPRVHRIDRLVWKLTGGRFCATEILGWNIIELTTVGARSKEPRKSPLIGLFDGEKIALIASSLGRTRKPGWYYNLKAHPECTVHWKGKTGIFIARELDGAEYQKYWQMGVFYYAGYEKYRARVQRHIPVILLEPKT
jgi:deazaflavin-dependent oxidoreductase (nitroreductase family)